MVNQSQISFLGHQENGKLDNTEKRWQGNFLCSFRAQTAILLRCKYAIALLFKCSFANCRVVEMFWSFLVYYAAIKVNIALSRCSEAIAVLLWCFYAIAMHKGNFVLFAFLCLFAVLHKFSPFGVSRSPSPILVIMLEDSRNWNHDYMLQDPRNYCLVAKSKLVLERG